MFDVNQILSNLFGYRGMAYKETPPKRETGIVRYEDGMPEEMEEGSFVNLRSTVTSRDMLGRPFFMPVKLGGVVLQSEPTVLISSSKTIVKTALAGSSRRGTVKELISVEDYELILTGVVFSEQNKKAYPEDRVKELNDLYNRNESLPIECALTSLLGIYRVVIERMELPDMIGYQNAQAYRFNCVSDEDFEIEID